jgi:hypothetical protein
MPEGTELSGRECEHVRLRAAVRLCASLLGIACVASLAGCADKGWNGELPNVDQQQFAMTVYPILMRDCAFNDCHGGTHRFFQVFGPGRVRLDPMTDSEMPATPQELQVSYERARSMLVSEASLSHSLLLTKPLAIKAGGSGHRGVDAYGRNVYQSKDDPGYQAILQWAQGTMAAAPIPGQPPVPTGSGGTSQGKP